MKRGPVPAPPPEPPPPAGLPWTRAGWALALLAAVSPLWLARELPLVDLPEHLDVLEALRRLHDPATLFPQYFAAQARLTPYLGYYAVVGALQRALPLELANRLFLSARVAGLPLAMAFLLRSLRRPAWPALLVVPFAYGDCFAWGFVSTCAALPLALVSLGAFVRVIGDSGRRWRRAVLLAASSLAGFAMHPAPTGFLALAVPWLVLTTPAP